MDPLETRRDKFIKGYLEACCDDKHLCSLRIVYDTLQTSIASGYLFEIIDPFDMYGADQAARCALIKAGLNPDEELEYLKSL